MEKVIVGGNSSYDMDGLKSFFERALREIDLKITRGNVLIKPNLLKGKPPERAITTHPVFLRALIEFLKDHSCQVSLGDSPGYEPLDRVLRAGGYLKMLKQLGIKVVPFTGEIKKKVQGISPYREFLFGEDPDRYDIVVNVPKLKTHVMTGMTLGVKNTYGFVRGFEKGRWHLKAGKDRNLFASIIVDVHRIVSPAVTILDGILGMCGDGPGSGDPVKCGIVALSRSAFALDDFVEGHLCPGADLPVTACARRHGLLGPYELIDMGLPPSVAFPMPGTSDTDWNLPAPVKRILRNIFLKKPGIIPGVCQACGVCAKVCPAGAIDIRGDVACFDYTACIRCYCCHEMCPHNAIKI